MLQKFLTFYFAIHSKWSESFSFMLTPKEWWANTYLRSGVTVALQDMRTPTTRWVWGVAKFFLKGKIKIDIFYIFRIFLIFQLIFLVLKMLKSSYFLKGKIKMYVLEIFRHLFLFFLLKMLKSSYLGKKAIKIIWLTKWTTNIEF